jgi:predicted nucleic-acid-binding Zn-ribbon protein
MHIMSEDKMCPKCGSRMLSDKKFGSGAVETSLFNEGEFRGDDIKAYYCRKCGFVELYRKEKKRLSAVITEKELWDYSDPQE